MTQEDVFSAGEGDAWLARNRAHLEAYDLEGDPVARAIQAAGLTPRSIADLGCSLGTRLSALCARHGARGVGVEPSASAVAAARARDGDRTWLEGTLDRHPPLPGAPFDLVVVSFVLHWVDRRRLLASLAAVDAAVAEGGCLLIADFLPDFPQRRSYHHLPDAGVFTFKNDYPAMLLATGLYRPLLRQVFDYPDWSPARPGGEVRAQVAVLERIRPEAIPLR